ncbi:transcriptional regulator [Cytophaga hutchinsonii ATCC 33406]|uniref:Transcriptional regulator n=2 Tax=Cytophaga hutchinsonii TaxID=985 RepID=A0A6N4SND1_CYTH3|nr:transcriptional regulator [Cytophaga hutchinsonii ATCC 33406]
MIMSLTKEHFLKTIGKKIKTLREAKGLSQYALSDESGISRSQIVRLENGDLNCTLATLLVLAETLGVEPKDLLDV